MMTLPTLTTQLKEYFPTLEHYVEYDEQVSLDAPVNVRLVETHQYEFVEDLERYGEEYTLFTVYVGEWFFYLEVTHRQKHVFVTGYSYQDTSGLQILPDTAPVELQEMYMALMVRVLDTHAYQKQLSVPTATSWG